MQATLKGAVVAARDDAIRHCRERTGAARQVGNRVALGGGTRVTA